MTIESVIQQIEDIRLEVAKKHIAVTSIVSEYMESENITTKHKVDIIDSLSNITLNFRKSIKALQDLKDVIRE